MSTKAREFIDFWIWEQCSPHRTTADGGSVAGRYRA